MSDILVVFQRFKRSCLVRCSALCSLSRSPAPGPPMAALASICIRFHDCPMPVSLPTSPSYYLPVHLALRQSRDRIHHIRLLFKTTGMVEGSCSRNRSSVLVHFFFRGLSFHNSTFSNASVG